MMLRIQKQTFTQMLPPCNCVSVPVPAGAADRVYNLVAVNISDGETLHRPILALSRHLPLVEYLDHRSGAMHWAARHADQLDVDAHTLAQATGMSETKVRALLALGVGRHQPLLRPLVIRAKLGERILVSVTNRLAGELLNTALVDDNHGIQVQDTAVPLKRGETHTLLWRCRQAGIYPIYNQVATSMAEHRCLLGVLIVES